MLDEPAKRESVIGEETPATLSGAYTVYTSSNKIDHSIDAQTGTNLGAPVQYDPSGSGNVIADGLTGGNPRQYLYDAEGRVCAVQLPPPIGGLPNQIVRYLYDADGNRIGKETTTEWSCNGDGSDTSSLTNEYVLDQSGQQVTEFDGNGNRLHTNAYAGGQLIATYDFTSPTVSLHYHFADWLGTQRLQVSPAGVMEDSWQSLPFGEFVPTNNQVALGATEHHFTGKERDSESGLDYFGARYFGSTMGRFMSPDPLLNSSRPDDPQTWNRYTYALNNPLKIVDPTGLYNLADGCLQDKACAANAKLLRDGLAALNKALDDPKTAKALGLDAVARLSQGLAAMGTENDGNNVGVKFEALAGTAAASTSAEDVGGTGHYNFTVTFDPSKNTNATSYAINGDHEGIHAYDYTNYMENSATTMTPFQQEYRGYQNTSWSAQALGQSPWTIHTTHGDFQVWNSSWSAVDRQTLRDKGITQVVTDKNHPETQPHNPNTP